DVPSLACAPDGKTLASASRDRTVRLWNVAKNREQAGFPAPKGWSHCMIYGLDGPILVTGGADDLDIKLWNVCEARNSSIFAGPSSGIISMAHCLTSGLLAVGCVDGTVGLWDTASQELKFVLHGDDTAVT